MSDDYSQFEKRKQDHIELALMQINQAEELNALDRVSLIHEALPDLDFNDITISSVRFNKPVVKPLIVSSMTAGHRDAIDINRHLMAAASESEWAMGVGSQRRELTDKTAADEWRLLRQEYPNVSLFGNLGIAQLILARHDEIRRLIDVIEAEALIIHCNPLQECIQPEGTPFFKGCWDALSDLVNALSIPVVVKETGCGFSKHTMKRLIETGVAAVDVSGLGGTHWGRIEGHRADELSIQRKAAATFHNWGIDTVSAVIDADSLQAPFEVWGSGGVRHGLDAAKLLALGATTIGFAKPMLQAAVLSTERVLSEMLSIEYELKVAMFCTGSGDLSSLRGKVCRL